MENAVDALKIAAAILVFIIAIGSSFSLFGTAKHTADSIINMRDKQAYLDAAELDGGILYTSSETIKGNGELTEEEIKDRLGVNTNGDRIVSVEDVISTMYRYSKEKYGVTIIKDGNVLARYDSNTDNVMNHWYNIVNAEDESGNLIASAETQKINFANKIKERISTKYEENVNFEYSHLEELYRIKVEGNGKVKCGAPWYGNEEEIEKRISHDLDGTTYTKHKYTTIVDGNKVEKDLITYTGKGLLTILNDTSKTIIEVTNEIDQSTYLKDKDDENNEITTNLLQEYEMPAVEIVYIIM